MSLTDQGEEKEKMTPESTSTKTYEENINAALYGTQGQEKPNTFNKPDRSEIVQRASRPTKVQPSVIQPGEKIPRIPDQQRIKK
jgi:hypothetical protein